MILPEFPVKVNSRAVEIASEWHGGQTCPLYSLSSTGMLHSWEHALALYGTVARLKRRLDAQGSKGYNDEFLWLYEQLDKLADLAPSDD